MKHSAQSYKILQTVRSLQHSRRQAIVAMPWSDSSSSGSDELIEEVPLNVEAHPEGGFPFSSDASDSSCDQGLQVAHEKGRGRGRGRGRAGRPPGLRAQIRNALAGRQQAEEVSAASEAKRLANPTWVLDLVPAGDQLIRNMVVAVKSSVQMIGNHREWLSKH